MGSKKNILIIHPEGNIFNNPNLLSIANTLSKDFMVDVLMPFNNIETESKFKTIFYKKIWDNFKFKFFFMHYLFFYFFRFFHDFKKYDYILGVDREGIMSASILSKKYNCPYSLISYEIMFKDETSLSFKKDEIDSCRNIKFAIVQDKVRGNLLSKENFIPIEKLIYIPVASSGKAKVNNKTFLLYDILDIPKSKKLLIFTGSVASWTCIDEILVQAKDFLPENWVLVIHDRYGEAEKNINKMNLDSLVNEKVYLTSRGKLNFHELDYLLSDADLGIVSYRADRSSRYTGENISNIGMSSGKFSTYLKNCLPVVIYNSDELAKEVQENKLGFSCNDLIFLKDFLLNFKSKMEYETQCENYFNTKLSFDNYSKLLKDSLDSSI